LKVKRILIVVSIESGDVLAIKDEWGQIGTGRLVALLGRHFCDLLLVVRAVKILTAVCGAVVFAVRRKGETLGFNQFWGCCQIMIF